MTNQNSNGNNNNNSRDWNGTNPQSAFGQYGNDQRQNQAQGNTSNPANTDINPVERQFLGALKEEIANELGINLGDPNITAHNAGRVGGNMVKRMINQAKTNQNQQDSLKNK